MLNKLFTPLTISICFLFSFSSTSYSAGNGYSDYLGRANSTKYIEQYDLAHRVIHTELVKAEALGTGTNSKCENVISILNMDGQTTAVGNKNLPAYTADTPRQGQFQIKGLADTSAGGKNCVLATSTTIEIIPGPAPDGVEQLNPITINRN